MPEECTHVDAIRDVTPSALGCRTSPFRGEAGRSAIGAKPSPA
jgi:hypothetical protein